MYTGTIAARVAVAGLVSSMAVSLGGVVLSFWMRASLRNPDHFDALGFWAPPPALEMLADLDAIGILATLVFSAIAFLVWMSKTYRFATEKARAIESPVTLAGGPIIAWFIPFANLYLPFARLKEMWLVIVEKPATPVMIWYALWLARSFSSIQSEPEPDLALLAAEHTRAALAPFADFLAAGAAAYMVLRIDAAARAPEPSAF